MIHKESHSSDWIKKISKQHNADAILVEKVIRALTLLEGLKKSGVDFIFKGGTALMLIFSEIKRLSIDIDIILTQQPENIDVILNNIAKENGFTGYKEQERTTDSKIIKAHYKFFYLPVTNTRGKEEYILLDILFENNPYGQHLRSTEIKSPFLSTEGKSTFVTTPTEEAILGDKLTAYAPNTTGIKYNTSKELEIIKQLFDIGHLFNLVNDVTNIKSVFEEIGKSELEYRGLTDFSHDSILDDIYETSLCLSLRGQAGTGNFDELQRGIRNIYNFITSESFRIESAIISASKAAYLSALIKKNNKEIKRYTSPLDVSDLIIESPSLGKLNKLKKSNTEAFFYWYHTIHLLK